jgi:hypothetical protein
MSGRLSLEEAVSAYMNEQYADAFPALKQLAADGDPTAQFLLALMYRNGEGVAADEHEYTRWLRTFEESARRGDPGAQWSLSCKYRWGDHFPQDIARANEWLERAAEGGNADAQYHLAHYYKHGEFGYLQDSEKAHSWLTRAADQEHPEALWVHSFEFFGSDGQPTEHALQLIRRAAAKGCPPARDFLQKHTH